nr:serine protease snake-like isoform X1 [Danaus plexippus plexippus]XP_032526310.1 serine protease snake-like isoform X1 [Danaus plexippus plexippus]
MTITLKLLFAITSIAFSPFLSSTEIGDPCPGGHPGVCADIYNCTSALINIKLRKPLYHCFFINKRPIVCCNDASLMNSRSVPRKITTTTTAPVARKKIKRVRFSHYKIPRNCSPIASNLTVPKTGQKAFDKCLYYQEKYVYPCLDSPLPGQAKARANYCTWSSEGLIVNGENASRGEFPHMALLGFGTRKIEWKCGGTIISERFVLTAAHCTKTAIRGSVTKIKIGILKSSEPDTDFNVYNVFKIHVHENYHSPLKYNDIALLETDREMLLGPEAFPACLNDGTEVSDTVIVSGWGQTSTTRRIMSDVLQKAYLKNFDESECHSYHEVYSHRNMPDGIDSETQICFGNKNNASDTCGGDSGGPAQIKHPKVYCMYLVMGVTSFGRSCGLQGAPGVYTRVSHFLPWIERTVWP